MMPSWFVFDIGNVLIRLGYERVLEAICAQSDVGRDGLITLMEGVGGYRDLERGLVSFRDFHRVVCQRGGFRGDLAELRRIWSDFFDGPVEGMEHLLGRIRSRYKVAFLSNSNEVHEEVIAREFSLFFKPDEPVIYSHRVRIAKPDYEIFMKLLERLDVKSGDVIYTDDLAENVRAARDLGLQAFLFEGALELERQLEGEGLL